MARPDYAKAGQKARLKWIDYSSHRLGLLAGAAPVKDDT
jgi:hypothetical protein